MPKTVQDLMREFSKREEVPVDLDDVVATLKAWGHDEIYYFNDVDLDPATLSGHIVQEEIPSNDKGDFYIMTTITYAKMGHEMERMVCCKELLHVLDPDEYLVDKPEELQELIEKIILPAELVDPITENAHTINDRIATTQALAVLFPLAARNMLMPIYESGELSLRQIGDMVEIPPRYIAMVLSDLWPAIHEVLIR